MATAAATVMNFSYAYFANGNMQTLTNNRDTGRTESFTYDSLNRVATAKSQATSGGDCWGQNFGYDRYANLLTVTVSQCTATGLSVSVNTSNHITNAGFTYDAAGNLTADGWGSYTWDAESRQASATVNRITTNYIYDGDGARVRKSGALYWRDLGGEVLAETFANGALLNEYVYFAGRRIARRDASGNIYYYYADHLGSSRVIAQPGQSSPCYDADFYPFGAEKLFVNSCAQNYKFTAKERDPETGNDYFGARHYESNLGRFMSPDPFHASGRPDNPQSWNRYAYTYNNPLAYVDHNGKWPTDIHNLIIDQAFPGLSVQQRNELKEASRNMDGLGHQTQAHSHDHAMRAPNVNAVAAGRAIDRLIESHEKAAQRAQGGTSKHASDIKPAALQEFGQALHTVEDRTSPAHTDRNGNPREWYGIPTTPAEAAAVKQHGAEEATITPQQMSEAVHAARQAFERTFGDSLMQEVVITPQQQASQKEPQ